MYTYHPNSPAPPKQKTPSDTEILLDLTLRAAPFLSTRGRPFVRLALGDEAFQVLPARSPALRDWLVAAFFHDHERVPREPAIRAVLRTLEALAYNSPREPEHIGLRLAARDNRVFLDLASNSGEAVEITPDGWEIVQGIYHYFFRSRSTGPHPRPVKPSPEAEPLAPLRALLPLAAPRDWHRCLAWLISALRPTGPYPILVLQGPPGAGKSLAAGLLRNLVDPSPAPFTPPGPDRQVLAAACDRWVLAFDHISRLSTRLSDTLSRLSTGAAFSLRDLHDARTPIPLHLQRPIILTLNSAELRDPALADRALVVNLESQERRRAESDLRAGFDTAHPHLLGALCTAVSTALRRLPDTKLDTASRFPDAAAWAAAAAPALGLTEQEILAVFDPDPDPLLPPIATLMQDRDSWTGPANELLDLLPPEARPANPRALSHRLRRSAAAFAQAGFHLTFSHTHRGRPISIAPRAQPSPVSRPARPRWDRIRRWPKKKSLPSASKPVLPSWRSLSSSSRAGTSPWRPPCRPLRGVLP